MSNWSRLAVFDLETTGVDTDTARIVTACVAVLDAEGDVIARWDWMADPGVEIPEGAAAVHGISTERARAEGRDAGTVIAEITQTLRVLTGVGTPLVVYNAPYDLTLLDRECRRHGLEPLGAPSPVIDPLVIDKAVDKYRKGKRTLVAAAEIYGVTLDDAHDAGSDAIAAGRVAQALARAYPDEVDVLLTDLHGRQEIWFAEQAASFTDYIRRVKGDESFSADESWPLKAALEHPQSVLDTQPLPTPAPRPSRTVPHLDFATGALELDGILVPMLQLGSGAPAAKPQAQLSPPAAPDSETPTAQAAPAAPEFDPTVRVVTPPDFDPTLRVEPSTDAPADEPAAPFSAAYAAAPPPSRKTVLRIAAAIIIDGEGRTLLVRKRGTSAYMQAGGKIEQGESALKTLSRELREEIGLDLDLDATEYIGSFRADAANEPNTVIRAEVFAITVDRDFTPQGEIEQLIWIETDDPFGIELAPLTRDTILPLWMNRRSALF